MILVRPWSASPDYTVRQFRSRYAFETYRSYLRRRNWTVIEFPTPPGLGPVTGFSWARYGAYLKALWSLGEPVVIWEHDVVPLGIWQVVEIADCEHPWAMFDMPLPTRAREGLTWFRSRRLGPCFVDLGAEPGDCSFRVLDPGLRRGWRWGRLTEEWADFAPAGLVKFDPARLGPLAWETEGGPLLNIDDQWSRLFQSRGFRCHVHWPRVEHDHPAHRPVSAEGLVENGVRVPTVSMADLDRDERELLALLRA